MLRVLLLFLPFSLAALPWDRLHPKKKPTKLQILDDSLNSAIRFSPIVSPSVSPKKEDEILVKPIFKINKEPFDRVKSESLLSLELNKEASRASMVKREPIEISENPYSIIDMNFDSEETIHEPSPTRVLNDSEENWEDLVRCFHLKQHCHCRNEAHFKRKIVHQALVQFVSTLKTGNTDSLDLYWDILNHYEITLPILMNSNFAFLSMILNSQNLVQLELLKQVICNLPLGNELYRYMIRYYLSNTHVRHAQWLFTLFESILDLRMKSVSHLRLENHSQFFQLAEKIPRFVQVRAMENNFESLTEDQWLELALQYERYHQYASMHNVLQKLALNDFTAYSNVIIRLKTREDPGEYLAPIEFHISKVLFEEFKKRHVKSEILSQNEYEQFRRIATIKFHKADSLAIQAYLTNLRYYERQTNIVQLFMLKFAPLVNAQVPYSVYLYFIVLTPRDMIQTLAVHQKMAPTPQRADASVFINVYEVLDLLEVDLGSMVQFEAIRWQFLSQFLHNRDDPICHQVRQWVNGKSEKCKLKVDVHQWLFNVKDIEDIKILSELSNKLMMSL